MGAPRVNEPVFADECGDERGILFSVFADENKSMKTNTKFFKNIFIGGLCLAVGAPCFNEPMFAECSIKVCKRLSCFSTTIILRGLKLSCGGPCVNEPMFANECGV